MTWKLEVLNGNTVIGSDTGSFNVVPPTPSLQVLVSSVSKNEICTTYIPPITVYSSTDSISEGSTIYTSSAKTPGTELTGQLFIMLYSSFQDVFGISPLTGVVQFNEGQC